MRNAQKSRTRKMKIYCKKFDKRSRKTRLFTTKEVCRCKYAKMKPSYQAPAEQDVTPRKACSPKKSLPNGLRLSAIRMLIRH